jgi:putative NADPH-quinone reductase
MRAVVVYCHPRGESFTAAVRDVVLERLRAAGAEIRLTDLYAEGFDRCLSADEHAAYETCDLSAVARHTENLAWADTMIFVYPTWRYGLPAVLKGWIDRVLLPGLAFHLPSGPGETIRPGLTHITRLGVFTTCGASRILTFLVGAPGKRTLLRGLGFLCAPRRRTAFAAH